MAEFTKVDTKPITIEVDRWNRYMLPHPETGKVQAWTRCTTVAGTLADRFGLEQWDQRNIVWGLGQRPDLFARASAAKPDDKTTLKEVVAEAKTMAASKSGALLGSAIHQFTERIDQGEPLDIVPEMWRADVDAYRKTLEAARLKILAPYIEAIVCVPELGIAGQMDRLVDRDDWSRVRVGDVKTGFNAIKYGMAEIPPQLAIYAHARYWWTGSEWRDLSKIDQSTAVVFHMPPGAGQCDLYEIDIEAGWEAVQLAVDVRKWRQRKGLCEMIPAVGPVTPAAGGGEIEQVPPPALSPPSNDERPFASAARFSWARDRVEAIKAAGHGKRLAGLWSLRDEIPTFPKGGPRTDDELDAVVAMCDLVEMEFEMSFGAPDPTVPKQTKATRGKSNGTTNRSS